MSQLSENKKSPKYANLDMDKFKFDFRLFVPQDDTNTIFEDRDTKLK